MRKKGNIASNIQDHHTLGEYQRYFSHLLAKDKLKRYSLKEKNKLDPKKQYWKIKDEKGETYYYELPKYIKPNSSKSAYSMKRVMHRRPARAALAIFALTAIFSFSSSLISKKFLPSPNVPPTPIDYEGMQVLLDDFVTWKESHPTDDARSRYSVSKLAILGIANALFDSQHPLSNNDGNIFPRRPLLCVGRGSTTTIAIVYVQIANAFIYQDGNALEESISYSSSLLAPKVGRRDFYVTDNMEENDGYVDSNPGNASSPTKITWSDTIDRHYDNKDAYVEKAGKIPDDPFLYTINDETVLKGSNAQKTSDGYQININLDTISGVARYVKRMLYLSGKEATHFYNVNLTFNMDNNLRLLSMHVDEKYLIEGALDTTGEFTTHFYYDDIPEIPNRTESFNYEDYPF